MDEKTLVLLEADLGAQQTTIEQVYFVLEQRAEFLTPNNAEKLESAAYQLHNLYCAVEDLLKAVATYCENNIIDTSRWHSLLLKRMTQPVQGVRPALISQESYELLNALRAFRHFFRHAYGIPIDFAQLQSNLDKARRLESLLEWDLKHFLQGLRSESNG